MLMVLKDVTVHRGGSQSLTLLEVLQLAIVIRKYLQHVHFNKVHPYLLYLHSLSHHPQFALDLIHHHLIFNQNSQL